VKFPLVENGKGTQAVHDTVVAYNAAQRSGTACTKNVGEVAGTNKKPWRQKGTGRARAGSFRSPLWAGGGVVFGPKPRDFSKKVSKKTRSTRLAQGVERTPQGRRRGRRGRFEIETSPKTKEFIGVISALELKGTTLVVSLGH
jgi:large subunit ribosomal protein L4